jgi:uncharacterized repeat protein (TIGR03803 family)
MFGQTLTTLASFNGFTGQAPATSLIDDGNGNLYGTTFASGANGNGMIFKVNIASRSMTTLAPFNSTPPPTSNSGVITDANGNFFGTTMMGGAFAAGTVFEYVASTQTLNTVASFNSATTGYNPMGGVAMDVGGKLYGTTLGGSGGTVFEYNASTKTISNLATFSAAAGTSPNGLILGADGNLYGTAATSGAADWGTIFEYSFATHSVTALASFDTANGAAPKGSLVADAHGNSYGVTLGGTNADGSIFEYVAATHTLESLFSFNGANGQGPVAGLVFGRDGNLYGTTQGGGANGFGTIFEFSPDTQTLVTLYSFAGGDSGASPSAALLLGNDGNLYGTTVGGGTGGGGTVFELSLPEPASLSVMGIAALGICRRRRREAA